MTYLFALVTNAIWQSWTAGFSARPGKSLAHRFRMAVRVASRSVMSPTEFISWCAWLHNRGSIELLTVNPLLTIKPLRPYMAADWRVPQRIRVLMETLEFMGARSGIFRELLVGRSVVLASFDLPTIPGVSIHLSPNINKEGELTLSLHLAGVPGHIVRVIFSFDRIGDDDSAIRIGCVQGNRLAFDIDRNLERAMHGLRPKVLMVIAIQELARYLDVPHIFGVATTRHVYAKKHALSKLIGKSVRTLQMNYDDFWLEVGGTRDGDGWFRLPARFVKRPYAEIRPNKRSMYKKRYLLVDQIAKNIGVAVAGHQQPD